ncbi:MAG: hypothetical protein U0804_16795 [Gemmataceae bacterium]
MPSRRALPFVALFASAAVVGCGGADGVKSYHAPRAAVATAPVNSGKYRLLGAMVPADDPVWFFKLSGDADELARYEPGFDALIKSVRFKGEKAPPEFTPPDGWKIGPGRAGIVRQTVLPPGTKLDVTVVYSLGGVAENLERWVKMLGNAPAAGDEVRYTTKVDAAGGPVRRVDIRGNKNPSAAPMMGKMR